MQAYRVQLWPNGEWDRKDYQTVEAATPKAAAGMLCGCPLRERGSLHQIRAQVRLSGDFKNAATIFYEV